MENVTVTSGSKFVNWSLNHLGPTRTQYFGPKLLPGYHQIKTLRQYSRKYQ